jgi:hypothetical protein
LEVESTGSRAFQCALEVEETPATVGLDDVLGFAVPESLLVQHLTCRLTQIGGDSETLTLGTHFKVDATRRQLDITRRVGAVRKTGEPIRMLLKSKIFHTNGPVDCPDLPLSVPLRVGWLKMVPTEHLSEPAEIDYHNGEIRLDMGRPEWDWTLVLFDRRVQVVNKRGGVNRPLGELDLRNERLLINWEHPVHTQMDERGFLRTALSWVLAKEAASGDADQMMELALRLLSFRTGVVDA